MANTNYRILLEAQIDPKSLDAQIKTISAKNTILLNPKFDQSTMDKLKAQLDKIKASGAEISKITLFGGKDGKPAQAAIQYLDANKNIVKATIDINKGLITTHSTMQNLTKDANEFAKSLLNADKFLEKSKNMAQTPSVKAAVRTAEQIKVAVSDGDIEKVRQLNQQLAVQKSGLVAVRSGLDSWAKGMGNAIKQTIEYSLSIGLVYGALNQIKQGIQYIKDLNKELTNIQLVTGGTAEETAQLAVGYNNLAKEMGGTTIEVAKGSLEYVRQGKNAEDTGILIRDTMMLAKLGNMETADATERLTAIMNGFKLEAGEVGTVVDKLVQLDNNYATSVDEISTAMRYSSNSAQQAGVDFDHLAAYITVVSSTTRMSAETIGQAMKTMLARFTDIKAGKIDEDGLGLNNVETALARVNVSLRDEKNSFRDIQDVIADVGKIWGDIGETEQANVAKAVAGVRQKEQFLVLMEHQVDIQNALNKEREAGGLAEQRYAIYLESIEAAQNKLTASWEQMVSSTANKEMITSFYKGATAILDWVNAAGGIPTVLKIAIPLLIAFNFELLNTTRLALLNKLGVFFTGLQSLVGILPTVTTGLAGVATAEGAVTAGATAMTIATATATVGLSLLIAGIVMSIAKAKELRAENLENLSSLNNTSKTILDTSKNYNEYVTNATKAANSAGYFFDEQGKGFTKGYHGAKVYVEGLELVSEAAYNMHDAMSDADRGTQGLVDIMADADRGTDRSFDSFTKVNSALEDTTFYTGEASLGYKDLATTMDNLTGSAESVADIIKKATETGTIDFADVPNIPPEYLDALTVEGDKLKINIDLIKQKQLADAEMAVQSAITAKASQADIDILTLYYQQLLAESQNTFGAFKQTAWDYESLMWEIANQSAEAGKEVFFDMQGNALNSAQAIHDFMAGSDANFMSIVQQYANALGISVSKAMQMVQGYVNTVYNDAVGKINSLSAAMNMGISAGSAPYAMQWGAGQALPMAGGSTPLPTLPSGLGGSKGGGGGGGKTKAEKKAEADKKRADEARKREEALQKEIDNARKGATEGLKDQLDVYKDILDKRKDILDSMLTERSYQQDIADQNKNILNIQNELAALQFDTSAEAQARTLQLQDDLAKAQRDLQTTQLEHSVDQQKAALDADYATFEAQINKAIKAVEAINASSVGDFTNQLAKILAGIAMPATAPTGGTGATVPAFHNGGMVGNSTTLKSNELFAKLMTDELVVTSGQMQNFMTSTLPKIAQGTPTGNGGVEINMPISVAGSLDKSVIPDLERITNGVVKKINEAMSNRGYTRRADTYGI